MRVSGILCASLSRGVLSRMTGTPGAGPVASSSQALSLRLRALATSAGAPSGTGKYDNVSAFRHLPSSMIEQLNSRPLDSILMNEVEASPGYDKLDTGGLISNKDTKMGDTAIASWNEQQYKMLRLNHHVAEVKRVSHKSAKGRVSSMSALVVVGNGSGAGGFAAAKAQNVREAIEKAKYKAMKNMHVIERYDNRTILYPVDGKYGATRLRMRPTTDGYGLVAHRVILEICALVGISDISVSQLGSSNVLNIVRCTFKCFGQLMSMKDYCLKNRLNAVDFRRVMSRHAMFAPRTSIIARQRQNEIIFKKPMPNPADFR